jgi:hypothetical protein
LLFKRVFKAAKGTVKEPGNIRNIGRQNGIPITGLVT